MRRLVGWLTWASMPLWVLACVLWASSAVASQFGCKGLASLKETPVLEGNDGVFYRIQSDLRMDHRVSQQAIEYMAELSRALAENGTLLVYLPVPTKGLAMPQMLPRDAQLYGYDAALAGRVFQGLIARFEAAGVATVDALPQMTSLAAATPPFFKADFHWTSFGARAAAIAVAERLQREPNYQAMEKARYTSQSVGQKTAFSGLRRLLQLSCHDALPPVVTTGFETVKTSEGETASVDLFAEAESVQIALVGTSFSDSDINNFAGFVSEATGLDVVNYALTGGNQFGAIQDYLTSREFHLNPPAILLWENPIYNSLTRFGDQPMRELIAAARGKCRKELVGSDGGGSEVDIPQNATTRDTVLLDLGMADARRVAFNFEMPDGSTRRRVVQRSSRQTPTGRFFMPLSGFGTEFPTQLRVDAPNANTTSARFFLCN